ncbi:mCG147423 [Mus musculus]|nr:mCG147423 [Mus musculus]
MSLVTLYSTVWPLQVMSRLVSILLSKAQLDLFSLGLFVSIFFLFISLGCFVLFLSQLSYISLFCPGYPQTHSVGQAGLIEIHLPLPLTCWTKGIHYQDGHLSPPQRRFSMVILNLVKVTVKINHDKDPITGPIKSLYFESMESL